VRHRQVGEGEPEHYEQQHGAELDALGKGADDQAGRDAREGELEDEPGELGQIDALAERRCQRTGVHSLQEQPVEAADEVVAVGEREAVAVDRPEQRDQAEGHEDLHQQRQHVLGTHHARVEQGQARDRHEDDQHRRGHHPGRVALVGDRGVLGEAQGGR
jgi:hypothetical protein